MENNEKLKLIRSIVCNYMNKDPELMIKINRNEYLFEKQLVAYLSIYFDIDTQKNIANFLELKGHSSIITSCKKIQGFVDVYEDKKILVNNLIERCLNSGFLKEEKIVTSAYKVFPGI